MWMRGMGIKMGIETGIEMGVLVVWGKIISTIPILAGAVSIAAGNSKLGG